MAVIGRIIRGWSLGAAVVLPLLAVLVAADVALRYLFDIPLQWGSDVKELMLLLLVTAGLPGTSLAGQHIRVALFDGLLPRAVYRAAGGLRHVLAAMVMAFVAYALAELALDMHRYGDQAEMIAIPYWPIAGVVAASAALSALAEAARSLKPGQEGTWNR